jgi:aldehyde dehydrogenase family 7 protein A1
VHTKHSVELYKSALAEAVQAGGNVEFGGKVLDKPGNFVMPTIISGLAHNDDVVLRETFVPILYIIKTKVY